MTSTDSDSIPIISQLSQLKTLVESTQVKREIIEDYNLDQLVGMRDLQCPSEEVEWVSTQPKNSAM